ncbi:MAG: Crp/Fnr family transcriptional regulator, partial [Pseudomonadota bacterium]
MLDRDVVARLAVLRGCSESLGAEIAAKAGYLRFEGDLSGQSEVLPAGHRIYGPGDASDAVYAVLPPKHARDVAAVYAQVQFESAQGKTLKFDRVDEGRVFGEYELLLGGFAPGQSPRRPPARETAAELLTPAVVVAIPAAILAKAAAEDGRIYHRLVQTGVRRLRDALTLQTRARQSGGDVALADYLMRLADDFGIYAGNFTSFSIRVRQEDMARDLGISRRALSERLTAWSEAGLIRTAPLALLDTERIEHLRAIGSEAPDALLSGAAARLDGLIDAGAHVQAQRLALDLLRHFPSAPGLLARAGLASARAGRTDEAMR